MDAQFENLDLRTRRYMEAMMGVAEGILIGLLLRSKRLTPDGQSEIEELVRDAVRRGTPESLADELNMPGRMKDIEERELPDGRRIEVAVPSNAAQLLAESVFNRLYIMALCQRAIDDGLPFVVVIRFRKTAMIWEESEARIGERIDPRQLLDDLLLHPTDTPDLGIPPAPGSTLTVRLPTADEVEEFMAGLQSLDDADDMSITVIDPDE